MKKSVFALILSERVKFTVDSTGTREDDGGYRYLGGGAR